MKKLLIVIALGEGAAGLALLTVPSVVVWLLFGQEPIGVAVALARVTGIALLALSVACWPGPPLVGLLTYNAVATVYLAWLGFAGGRPASCCGRWSSSTRSWPRS
jgi:hypothetical protein